MQKDLISEKGFLNFIKEFKDLSEVQKPYWVNEKRVAAEHGDRSENAEYIKGRVKRGLDLRLDVSLVEKVLGYKMRTLKEEIKLL